MPSSTPCRCRPLNSNVRPRKIELCRLAPPSQTATNAIRAPYHPPSSRATRSMGLLVAYCLRTARTFMVTLRAAVVPFTRWPKQSFAVSSCAAGRTKQSQFFGPQPGRQSWPPCAGHPAAGNTGCSAQTWPAGTRDKRRTQHATHAVGSANGKVGAARPNPSFKRSANGRPPAPGRRYAVHFRRPGPRVTPLVPA